MRRIKPMLSVLALALSMAPARGEDTAPVLSELAVTSVAKKGSVLRASHQHPFSEFLLGIPVTVQPGSPCIGLAGQQTVSEKTAYQTIRMLGASDPVRDICIMMVPAPVSTQITLKMSVLTGGFVAADPIQRQFLRVPPLGYFEVTLDMGNESVMVRPVRCPHASRAGCK